MAYEDGDRVVYTIPSVLASAYFQGSFKMDFVSTFPFDKLTVATLGLGTSLQSLRVLRFLRLFRLLKLFRFLKFRQYMFKLQLAVVTSPYIIQVCACVENIFGLLMGFGSCVFFDFL